MSSIRITFAAAALGLALAQGAQGANLQEAVLYPSFAFDMRYAVVSSQSKFVASNDRGTALAYSVGGFAGSSKNIEYNLGFEKDTTVFQLNSSKAVYDWQDTRLLYHYGYFYAGAVFSRLNLKVNAAGVDVVDAAGSGYGGALGYLTGLGRDASLRIDVSTVNIAAMKNSLVTEVSVPSRLDIDFGATVEIYNNWLNFDFGYKMRTMTVKTASAFVESESMTYIGIRMSTSR